MKRKITKAKVKRFNFKESIYNPNKLKAEVHALGGNLTTQNILKWVLGLSAAAIGFSFGGGLSIFWGAVATIIFALFSFPFIKDSFYRKYQKRRFEDAVGYIESMLYGFKETKKIQEALIRTRKTLEDGELAEAIDEALNSIERGEGVTEEKSLYQVALKKIEKKFPSKRIKAVHNLMITSETKGGDFASSVEILLNDRRSWVDTTETMMQAKQKKFGETIASAVISALLCMFCSFVYKILPKGMNIVPTLTYQVSYVALMTLLLLVIKRTSKKLNTDWIRKDSTVGSRKSAKDYDELLTYDMKAKTERYMTISIPFIIGAGVLFLFKLTVFAIPALLIGALMIFVPRIEYHLLYKNCKNEVLTVYPQWLVQMTLLLQNNTVANAIIQSRETAPSIMKNELDELIERIDKEPEKLTSYTDFFKFYDIREIRNSMQTFYTMALNGSQNKDQQLATLLESNYFMQKQAEELIAENDILSVKNMFQLPMAIASFKLIVDLMLMVITSMPALLNMSGAIGQ
jgi:hypothetical protein